MVCAKIHKKNEKTKTAELFFEKPSGKIYKHGTISYCSMSSKKSRRYGFFFNVSAILS